MAQPKDNYILWCDSDKKVKNQGKIIQNHGYKFTFFESTQRLITFYKANAPTNNICAIITSGMRDKPNGEKSGLEMIEYLKRFIGSMKNSRPVFAICSLTIKQHNCTKLISNNRTVIQKLVIAAIKNK
eukprot:19321_1